MHKLVKCLEQAGLAVDQRLVPASRRSQTSRRLGPLAHFGLGLDHRVATHARRGSHSGLAASAQHLRRGTRDHTPLHLVHMRQDHVEESRERLLRDLHTTKILRSLYLGGSLHRSSECHRWSTGALIQGATVRFLLSVLTQHVWWPRACCPTCRAGSGTGRSAPVLKGACLSDSTRT